jgi:hypothetical protein
MHTLKFYKTGVRPGLITGLFVLINDLNYSKNTMWVRIVKFHGIIIVFIK